MFVSSIDWCYNFISNLPYFLACYIYFVHQTNYCVHRSQSFSFLLESEKQKQIVIELEFHFAS